MESIKSGPEIIPISQPIPAHSSIGTNRDQDEIAPELSDEKEVNPPHETEFIDEEGSVPGTRLELVRSMRSGDFKSPGTPPLSTSKYNTLGDRSESDTQIIRRFREQLWLDRQDGAEGEQE